MRFSGKFQYWNGPKGRGGIKTIPGKPIIKALVGRNRNAPEFTMSSSGENEFQLENPTSGWTSVWFMIKRPSGFRFQNAYFHHSQKHSPLIKR